MELVFEPQCAAASFANNVQRKYPLLHMQVGDELVILDLGGGTGDTVSYRLRSSTGRGANVDLEVARQPKGNYKFIVEPSTS